MAHQEQADEHQQRGEHGEARGQYECERGGGTGEQDGGEFPAGAERVQGEHGEQGAQGELQALDRRGQRGAESDPDQTAADPVGLAGDLHRQQPGRRAFRLGQGGVDGVGLVDHGVDGVGLRDRVLDQVEGEGEGVEDVPEVDHEDGQRDRGQGGDGGHHADQQQLQGAGERGQGQGGGEPPGQAGLHDQQAESDTQGEDPEACGEGVADSQGDLPAPLGGSPDRDRGGFRCGRAGRNVVVHVFIVPENARHVVAKIARQAVWGAIF
ncbi:hypothetical protein AQJ27_01775 [Streptomyces olivochromogenes]|nr:hypothetical protein AQJ27_01775 [Streptomyces olivochromogenes]